MNWKITLRWFAVLTLIVIIYISAIGIWSWKWQLPSEPLPQGHLTHQTQNVSNNQKEIAKLAQQNMVSLAKDLQSVSMSGALSMNGEIIWAGTTGLATVKPFKTATTQTLYRIGSVSKSLTAVTLMRMVELNMIDLDEPISTYLTNYPDSSSNITARQLASHIAGVRHYEFDLFRFPPTDSVSNIHYPDVNEALDQFKDDDLLFTPGHNFSYSTHGYTLLSAVMQAAGKKPFESLVAELVTKPLGLTNTVAEHLLNSNELAGFYISDNGLYGDTPIQNLSNKVAGGGFVSTPSDLVKIGGALLNGRLLTPNSFSQMVSVQTLIDGSKTPQNYAIGWRHHQTTRILGEEHKVDVIHHGGVASGANAFLLLVPEHNISIAITTNGKGETSRGEIQMLAYRMAELAIKQQNGVISNSSSL